METFTVVFEILAIVAVVVILIGIKPVH